MKTKRRIIALLMSVLMCVSNFSLVSFAAEDNGVNSNAKVVSVEELENGEVQYVFELSPESTDDSGISTYLIESSFTMNGTYYRGADRKYAGNYLDYTIEVTGADGSSQPNKQIQAQLWDYNNNCLRVTYATANGTALTEAGIKIVPNRTYYFKYYLIAGGSSNLRVTMYFDTWG